MQLFGISAGAWPWFVVSVLVLALGPLLLAGARRWPPLLALLDGFVLASVGGIVVADVLPEALQRGGLLTLVLVAIGLMGPGWLETRLQTAAAAVHAAAMAIGLAGLALHAALDGAALAAVTDTQARGLATAVLLHRLPEGLTIWWLLAPVYGPRVALLVLLAVAGATAAGFGLASSTDGLINGSGLAWVQALVAGSLLHVVFHRAQQVVIQSPQPVGDPGSVDSAQAGPVAAPSWQWAAGSGALLGLALLLAVLSHHDAADGHAEQGKIFWDLARDSALALVIAYAAAGLVQSLLPVASLRWLSGGSRFSQALRGTLFGLPLPICSCGVVPVYRSLALHGVPAAAGLSFLVATPELGIDALLLSVPLLGGPMTIVRLASAALVAIAVGWLLDAAMARGWTGPILRAEPPPLAQITTKAVGLAQRLGDGLRIGFGDMVDHTGPWLLVGLAVATLGQPLLADGDLSRLPIGVDVPLFALLGMPMYVCASGATPLVAVLIAGGVSPGAGLAFLLTGPATNISTFGVLAQLHGRRLALGFAVSMATLAIVAGWVTNGLLPGYQVPTLGGADHDHRSKADEIALLVLAVLFAASLLRQGPRGFLGQVLDVARFGGPPAADDHGDQPNSGSGSSHHHHHGHGHHHDHGNHHH